MRIESPMPLLEISPAERTQPVSQVNDFIPLGNQFDTFQKKLSGSANEKEQDVDAAVHALNKAAEDYDIALQFSRDDETGAIVIRMVRQNTGEVVHQIPDEAMLHLSAVLGKLQGRLFSRTA
jgi:uncharacterized FlaG/YvyC family protein